MPPIRNPHFSRRFGGNPNGMGSIGSTSGNSSRSRSPSIPSTPTRRTTTISRARHSVPGSSRQPKTTKPKVERILNLAQPGRNEALTTFTTNNGGNLEELGPVGHCVNFRLPAITWPAECERLNGNSTVYSTEPERNVNLRTILRLKPSIKKLDKTPKFHVTFRDLNENKSAATIIFNNRADTFVPKILQYLNWYEILSARLVCKKWADLIHSENYLRDLCGVPTLRKSFDPLEVFNTSQFLFTDFRLFVHAVFDFTRPAHKKFFSKHGLRMNSLEICNRGMTLAALVYILDKCPNLSFLSVAWCPEMYAFNTDLLRKYFGVSFRLGGLSRLSHLKIESSCFLTDTALNSLLKWSGSNLKKLSLTCPHAHSVENEKTDDLVLNALKPRWSFGPLLNYILRFPHLDLLRELDFTGGNFSSEDLIVLAKQEKIKCITSLDLTSCKVDDRGVNFFLARNGASLQKLVLDHTAISDRAFVSDEILYKTIQLPKLQLLSLSGTKGIFRHMDFWMDFPKLTSLYVTKTSWFNFTSLFKPVELEDTKLSKDHLTQKESKSHKLFQLDKSLHKLAQRSKSTTRNEHFGQAGHIGQTSHTGQSDHSGQTGHAYQTDRTGHSGQTGQKEHLVGSKGQVLARDPKERYLRMRKLHLNDNDQLSKVRVESKVISSWFAGFCYAMANLAELDLSFWGCFMRDDNFVLICSQVPCLEYLRVRGWKELSDGAVTGFDYAGDEDSDLVKPFMKGSEEKEFVLAVGYTSDKNGNGGTKRIRNSIGSLQFLKTLDLSGCVRLTDNSIRLGLSNLRNLRKLGLENLKVTDVGVEHLLKYSKKLEMLNVSGCKGVTKQWEYKRPDGSKIQFGKF